MPKYDKRVYQTYACVVSPSTISTYLDCPRRVFFEKVVKLRQVKERRKLLSMAMGNVGHAALERWLLCDDSGRVPNPEIIRTAIHTSGPLKGQATGQPVELFPDGWHVDDPVTLDAAEQDAVRNTVMAMIEHGVVQRRPDRLVEEPFTLVVDEAQSLVVHGVIDVIQREGVEDHKFTSARKWIPGPKKLASDPKMICYAVEWLNRVGSCNTVWMRLNFGVRNPDDLYVKSVDVDVGRDEVMEYFHRTIAPAARGVLELKRSGITAEHWSLITGPQSRGVCQKYGGCPYADICVEGASVEEFREKVKRLNEVTKNGEVDIRSEEATGGQARYGTITGTRGGVRSADRGGVRRRRSRYQ